MESMKVYIASEKEIAKMAAQRYVQLINTKPNAIIGGATGSTPIPLYKEWYPKLKRIPDSELTSLNTVNDLITKLN